MDIRFINLKFIDMIFIDLKFIDIRFIKIKKHLSGKKVTYSLICKKILNDRNISSTKPVKVLYEQKLVY